MELNSPESVLAILKLKICQSLGITTTNLRLLIDHFVAVNFGNKNVGSHYMRVNMFNEISSPRMTIKVFFKFLLIIQIKKIEFTIRVTTAKGKVGEITHPINFVTDPIKIGQEEAKKDK